MSAADMSPLNIAEPRFAGKLSRGNQLLSHLAPDARAQLTSQLHHVSLARGQVIFHAHEPLRTAYFPEGCVAALLTHPNEEDVVDVGLVGRDGLVGIALLPGVNFMPCDAVVEVAGTALAISAQELMRVCRQSRQAHELLGRYAYTLFAQGVLLAGCNSFHHVGERCARSLLMIHDLSDGDEFPLTHDLLATLLGVRRSSVTLAAGELQRLGVIDYRHGKVRVTNRKGLVDASCACYRAFREEAFRLLGF
jgi:CRP-like cAMP-binding protein